MLKHVGVLYHPKREGAEDVARQVAKILASHGVASSLLPAWEDEAILSSLPDWQLIVTCGGDGTILRTTRLAAPFGVPQLGVNMGRLGFLADLKPEEVAEKLPCYLDGEYWIEERTMLRAELRVGGRIEPSAPPYMDALNEVLLARGPLPRVVRIRVAIDGVEYKSFGADGVLVATATGSTAYSLSAGGPVLSPRARDMVLTPICPHVLGAIPLVLPPDTRLTLEICGGLPGVVSVDGQVDVAIESNATVDVTTSPNVARFVRTRSQGYFYELIGRVLR